MFAHSTTAFLTVHDVIQEIFKILGTYRAGSVLDDVSGHEAGTERNLDDMASSGNGVGPSGTGPCEGARFTYSATCLLSLTFRSAASSEMSWTTVPHLTSMGPAYVLCREDRRAILAPELLIILNGTQSYKLTTSDDLSLLGSALTTMDYEVGIAFGRLVSYHYDTLLQFTRRAAPALQQTARLQDLLTARDRLLTARAVVVPDRETGSAYTGGNQTREEPPAHNISPVIPYDRIQVADVEAHACRVKLLPLLDLSEEPQARVSLDLTFTDPVSQAAWGFPGDDLNIPANASRPFALNPRFPFTVDRINANSKIVIGAGGDLLRKAELASGVRLCHFRKHLSTIDVYLGTHPTYRSRGNEAVREAVRVIQQIIQDQVPLYIQYLEGRLSSPHYQRMPKRQHAQYLQFVRSLRVETHAVYRLVEEERETATEVPEASATPATAALTAAAAPPLSTTGAAGLEVPVGNARPASQATPFVSVGDD